MKKLTPVILTIVCLVISVCVAACTSPAPAKATIASSPTSARLPAGLAPATTVAAEAPTSTATVQPDPTATVEPGRQSARVVRVVDGDTIDVEISGGGAPQRVRYIGMDTPETVDPNRPVGCFGPEASARNKALVDGKQVELEKDVSETDQFGRLLRYVYLDGSMVNETLVRDGYAQVATYPPDVKYADRFLAAQREAQAAGRGLWGACGAASPAAPATAAAMSTASCPQGCMVPPKGCVIKGNISRTTGEKIYHVPGGDFYSQTVVSPSQGERWFCTEAEAVANGWRKSKE